MARTKADKEFDRYIDKRDALMDAGGHTEYHFHAVVNDETGDIVMRRVGRRTSVDRDMRHGRSPLVDLVKIMRRWIA